MFTDLKTHQKFLRISAPCSSKRLRFHTETFTDGSTKKCTGSVMGRPGKRLTVAPPTRGKSVGFKNTFVQPSSSDLDEGSIKGGGSKFDGQIVFEREGRGGQTAAHVCAEPGLVIHTEHGSIDNI